MHVLIQLLLWYSIFTGKYYRRSKYQPSLQACDDRRGQSLQYESEKKSYYYIYCRGMLKTTKEKLNF